MFRRSGYRFADKNMRHSTESRACPDSEGTGHALAMGSERCERPGRRALRATDMGTKKRRLILMLFSLMGISSAAAERIVNDDGGRIAEYVAKYTRARDGGERIVVDGQCLSACTLVLALLPRERIC